MKKSAKIKFLCIILLIIVSLCGCTRSAKTDWAEINRRIKNENSSFGFDMKNAFYSNSVYFIYYSLVSENDVLLTLRENSENKIDRVSLTVSGDEKSEELKKRYCDFVTVLTKAFVPENEIKKMAETENEYFKLVFEQAFEGKQFGKYKLEFFSDTIGASFIISRN